MRKLTAKQKATGAAAAVVMLATGVIGGFEGLRTSAYRDAVGVPTVCYGETLGVHMGDRYTAAECRAMLGDRIGEFYAGIVACLVRAEDMPVKVRAAFLSLSYNIGIGAFCKSTVARKANVGDLRGACDAVLAWNRAGGKVLPGLTRRRQEERALCLDGLPA
jgi:lysozyme